MGLDRGFRLELTCNGMPRHGTVVSRSCRRKATRYRAWDSQEQSVTGVTNLFDDSKRGISGSLSARTHQEVEQLDGRLLLPLRGENSPSVSVNANQTRKAHPYQFDLRPNVPPVRLISPHVFSRNPTSKSNVVTGRVYSINNPGQWN